MWRSSAEAAKLTAFQRAVYELTYNIPQGYVTTYGHLSKALTQSANAARAVGTALHHNPFAPTVPCHRVLKAGSNGAGATLGGFHGVSESEGVTTHPQLIKKTVLLRKEGVTFSGKTGHLEEAHRLYTEWDTDVVRHARSLLSSSAPSSSSSSSSSSSLPAITLEALKEAAEEDAKQKKNNNISTNTPTPMATHLRALLSSPIATGADVRLACRNGWFKGHTSGLAPGRAQANLVILPKEFAYDFLLFCIRNPKPCPLLEVTDIGNPFLKDMIVAGAGGGTVTTEEETSTSGNPRKNKKAVGSSSSSSSSSSSGSSSSTTTAAATTNVGADIRTDFPRYRIWRYGEVDESEGEITDIKHLWPLEEELPNTDEDQETSSSSSSSSSADSGKKQKQKQQQERHPLARTDWVGFLLGCSFSFEEALLAHHLPVRHLQENAAAAATTSSKLKAAIVGAGGGRGGGSGSGDGVAAEESTTSASSGSSRRSGGSGTRTSRKRKHAEQIEIEQDDELPQTATQNKKQQQQQQQVAASFADLAARGEIVSCPRNVPMYRTSIPTVSAGIFGGTSAPLVVSMRPMTPAQAQQAAEVTAKFPRVHGTSVYAGDPSRIGITNIHKPDYGDAVSILPGEVPVFWACGVTPQSALAHTTPPRRIPIAITHAPGHMLVLDTMNADLAGFAELKI